MVNVYLEEMAKEAKNIITTICDEQCSLSDKVKTLMVVDVAVSNLVLHVNSCCPSIRLL